MTAPILATKLYIPPPRPTLLRRSRLTERLDTGLQRKLTLISAPAGFGKTTLLSDWLAGCQWPVAWVSLDEEDSDPARLLTYLTAAVQAIAPNLGVGQLGALQSPQPPPADAILTALLNEIATTVADDFVLVLDDYHALDAKPVDRVHGFLLDHLPPQMHLVIATREDPPLPLARLRAADQLTELRAADLRFTPAEASAFLTESMDLRLTVEDIAALESRTEGWIAGLQLAALSLQGQPDPTSFIASFSGSHRFVLDYLMEEVLQRQSERVQIFLLRTSILERLCGSLCDAMLRDPAGSGQAMLEYLERANLFVVPLDDERHWYRYHHLFAELLRQRVQQSIDFSARDKRDAGDAGDAGSAIAELHGRASQWCEEHGLVLDAFHHAAAAHDIQRAERLIERGGMPLHLRGTAAAILDWLESLPPAAMDARPSLWVRYASTLLLIGQRTGVEEKLQAAEKALEGAEPDEATRDLIGRIAAARATIALTQYQIEPMISQSRRALDYLRPGNVRSRANAFWTLGFAYFLQGDGQASARAYTEAIAIGQASGETYSTSLATTGLGMVQELENRLYLAAESFRSVLQRAGEQPQSSVCEAQMGLARVCYEWNDLEAAERHGLEGLQLARQYESVIDRFVICQVFLARLKLARGDVAGTTVLVAEASQAVRERNFVHRLAEVVAAQVLVLLRQGHFDAAAQLAQAHQLPLSQVRVHLAQGDPSAALIALEPWLHKVEAGGWVDERLKGLVLQALALQAQGDMDEAVRAAVDALALAEPGGRIRTFVDEGPAMARLVSAAAARGLMPDYIGRLLAAFKAETQTHDDNPTLSPAAPAQPLIEPLSRRELEVLRLIAQGCSNQDISERLFLALSTVKGHNRVIFDKLQVQRRAEAVARARELGLL
jgi:LuxR family maltose regulon positive regulatory protein